MFSRIGKGLLILCGLMLFSSGKVPPGLAAEPVHFISIYAAQMTSNNWEDFFSTEEVRKRNSHLLSLALGRRIGSYRDLASFEIEGQLVKHFNRQDHLELNALATARWEAFPWDRLLDTSLAFGMGPSYASERPEIEVENDGDTAQLLVFWMLELTIALPSRPQLELLARIHHRSSGYGVVAETGGSNALALGLRYRF